ncbi:hypothetical protein WSM22_33990 [Cytophagales bacterium WSM2-2]|nr:hypothetical protein WSM22_33990 [Cytophagales bacterium WSM2-2]
MCFAFEEGMTRFVLFFILIFVSTFVHAQQEWVLKKEKNGIFVYSLKTDSSAFNSIKVETEAKGTIAKFISIIKDVEGHNQWAYGTRTATVLKRVSQNEIIFYKEIESPGPVSDRDMIINLKVIGNDPNSVKIESVALPDYIPRKDNFVRVPMSSETWVVTRSGQKIKIKYFLKVDPGGTLSPFLVNLFSTKGPYESFENLKSLLEK